MLSPFHVVLKSYDQHILGKTYICGRIGSISKLSNDVPEAVEYDELKRVSLIIMALKYLK